MNWNEIRDKVLKIPEVEIIKEREGEVEFSFDTLCDEDGITATIMSLPRDNDTQAPANYVVVIGSISHYFDYFKYDSGIRQLIFWVTLEKGSMRIDLPEED